MSQIGAISVKISADDSGFQSAVKRVGSGAAKMGGELRESVNKYAKWGAAAAAAGAVAAAAIYKSTASQIDALAKHADKIGISVEALQAMRFAAEQTGVSVGTMDTALQRMTRRVSGAAQGTGEAVDALKELNLSAESLSQLSPDEQFASIAEAMEGVATQGDKVRLAMALFDTEGVALVNTMKGGRSAIEGFKDEAQALGLTLSRVDAAKVEAANDSMNRINKMIQGSLQQATAEFAPIVGAVADAFKDMVIEAGGFGPVINKVMGYAVKVIGVFANSLRGIQLIIKGLEVGFQGFALGVNKLFGLISAGVDRVINASISGLNQLIYATNLFTGSGLKFIGDFVNPATQMFEDNAGYWSDAVAESLTDMHELAMLPLPSDGIEQWVETVKAKAQEAAEAVAAATTGGADGATSSGLTEAESEALTKRLAAIQQGLMTESQLLQEKYAMDQEALVMALENELLTREEYNAIALERAKAHSEALTDIDKEAAQKRADAAEKEKQSKLAIAQGMFSNLSQLMNTGSRKMFEVGKAASIANALVSGYEAVTSSYAAGAKVGGPVVGAAFAATAAAATMAQIQQIKSQSFSKGAGGGAVNFQGGQPSMNTNGGGAVGPQQPGRNISISLTGSSFGAGGIRELIGQINDAIGDGVAINVSGGG